MPHSAEATTPLGRAIAIATAANFVIRPGHARARLDENGGVIDRRQRVLCGALGEHGRYTCGEEIALVVAKDQNQVRRELNMGPGWKFSASSSNDVWYPAKNLCQRLAYGHEARFRKPQRMYVGFSDAPDKVRKGHHSSPVTRFPVVAVCCDGHINILEADRLNVITDADRMRA